MRWRSTSARFRLRRPASTRLSSRRFVRSQRISYYGRLFREYIAAKRSLGDPIDHITEASFVGRIRNSEGEMREKHGKPVRYRVETRGREVILIAVPLS